MLSAAENVEYPLLRLKELSAAERRDRVAKYLGIVGLAKYADRRPNQLSGGQRQRVAIARALATHPKIVLADEPTANLDHKTGSGILQLMKESNRYYKTTFIFSTHDRRVMDMADRLVQVEDGEIRDVRHQGGGQMADGERAHGHHRGRADRRRKSDLAACRTCRHGRSAWTLGSRSWLPPSRQAVMG